MKTIINVLVACVTLMLATACALLAPHQLDGGARRAAAMTLETYAILQQAVLIYGHLPPCTTPPEVHLCRDQEHWLRIRAAEKAATEAIAAATPVLNAEEVDTGQVLRALVAIDTVTRALSDARHQLTEARP
jgi:hypothetical protein